MKWIETAVVIESDSPETAVDLVSGLFMEFCLQGVVIEEPGRDPFADWGEDAVDHSLLGQHGGVHLRLELGQLV